jgi:hypothetical protein
MGNLQKTTPDNDGGPETGVSAPIAAQAPNDSQISDADRSTEDQAVPTAPRIPFHPLAKILPFGDEQRVRELARRLTQGDPVDSITLYEGKVLDRPLLYLACLEAGREPTFDTYTGNDPLRFLIDRQLERGYPNTSQKGMLGARLVIFRSEATSTRRVCQSAEPRSW